MTKKALIDALIEEMEINEQTFIGTFDAQGMKVVKLYEALNKEVHRRNPYDIVCWDKDTGYAWIA